MTERIHRTPLRVLAAGTLLALLLTAGAPAVHAQIIFDVQLSDRGQEAITDPENMDAKRLLGLLAEEARLAYEGERPVEARLVLFTAGKDADLRERATTEPFKIAPGTQPMGRSASLDPFAAPLECALSACTAERTTAERAFPDGHFIPDGYFFPDSIFNPEKGFPDSTFEEMRLKDDQVGIVLALVPADDDLRREARSRPMGLVFSRAR